MVLFFWAQTAFPHGLMAKSGFCGENPRPNVLRLILELRTSTGAHEPMFGMFVACQMVVCSHLILVLSVRLTVAVRWWGLPLDVFSRILPSRPTSLIDFMLLWADAALLLCSNLCCKLSCLLLQPKVLQDAAAHSLPPANQLSPWRSTPTQPGRGSSWDFGLDFIVTVFQSVNVWLVN